MKKAPSLTKKPKTMIYKILLADDDSDDCLFFQEALSELSIESQLTIVNDGAELMDYLQSATAPLPDALFLDLNMPKKSGCECLSEIQSIPHFQSLPIIIFSTSFDPQVITALYDCGANYYIRKPGDFEALKVVVSKALRQVAQHKMVRPEPHDFIIQP